MSPNSAARNSIEEALVAHATANPAFRQALLKNSKAAIESALGTKLPDGVELRVVEETATTNYLVLPAKEELSDGDLEAVAGGFFAAVSAVAVRKPKSVVAALDSQAQSRSDLGQQLQLALQEANNIYTR